MKTLAILFSFLLLLGWSPRVDASDQGVSEYALLGGWVLPDQVPGMEEVLPAWGLRAGVGVGPQTLLALSYLSSLADGIHSHQANLEARYSAFSDGVIGYLAAGASFLSYSSFQQESVHQELGVLMGTGFMFQLSQEVWLQSQMHFRLKPGVQLNLLMGIVMRL